MTRDSNFQRSTWKKIGLDLGIEIETESSIVLDGKAIDITALVRNFGAENGMLIFDDSEHLGTNADLILARGYGYSCVSVDENCNGNDLVDMFNEWGFTGNLKAKPAWAH